MEARVNDAADDHGESPVKHFAERTEERAAKRAEWNADRYGYGPQNLTMPGSPGSFAHRRGSPVIVIAPPVEPW